MRQKAKTFLLITKLMKSTSVYAGGSLINQAIPFILLPILTRFLTPEDYGVLATFIAIFGVMQIFISMGTIDASIRAYFDIGKKGLDFSKYVFNGFLINFTVFITVLFLWHFGKSYFEKIIPIPFVYQLLIPLLSLCVIVYSVPCKLWVFKKEPLPYVIFNATNMLLEAGLAVFLIVFMHFNWQGRVLGILVSKLVFALIGIYILLKHKSCQISFNTTYIKDILNYGLPVVVHSSGFVIISAIDRFFLNKFIGLSATGIYSVSYSVCSLIGFVTSAFNAAWVPIFYEKLGTLSASGKLKLVKSTYIYFILVLFSVALFATVVPSILNILVGKKFLGAGLFIFWLALGFGFHGMYTLIVSYIFYEKKTYVLSKIAIVTVLLSFASNYVLIKINGAIGVAQATCLVFLVRFLLVWYFSNQVYPMPWLFFMRRAPQASEAVGTGA